MSTGRSVVSTCAARAALAGNPSDVFGGAVVAIPVADLQASASASEAANFAIRSDEPALTRLLEATAAAYAEHRGALPRVQLSASTTIPRSVGLGGSSALVIATLRTLAGWCGERWDALELAELALAVERDRLGIAAGLQDRLVQSVGRPVAMTFAPVAYSALDLPDDLALFVAWLSAGAAPSGTVHRSLRRRFDGGDPAVRAAMRELAEQAARARRGIESSDLEQLGGAMDDSFDIRASIVDVGDAQRRLVSAGRAAGAWVNSAGSGGSVVGLVTDRHALPDARAAYALIGADFLALE